MTQNLPGIQVFHKKKNISNFYNSRCHRENHTNLRPTIIFLNVYNVKK